MDIEQRLRHEINVAARFELNRCLKLFKEGNVSGAYEIITRLMENATEFNNDLMGDICDEFARIHRATLEPTTEEGGE